MHCISRVRHPFTRVSAPVQLQFADSCCGAAVSQAPPAEVVGRVLRGCRRGRERLAVLLAWLAVPGAPDRLAEVLRLTTQATGGADQSESDADEKEGREKVFAGVVLGPVQLFEDGAWGPGVDGGGGVADGCDEDQEELEEELRRRRRRKRRRRWIREELGPAWGGRISY
jgi:hypothetical protein